MDSLISIIVPVYNAEKYLHQCIDSIMAQSYKNFELLLVDDGSKDSSGAICDDYAKKDSRIRVYHKQNGGVSSARNYGLDNAQGTHVCFVDSDDWVENTYLEDMIKPGDYDLVLQGMNHFGKITTYPSQNIKDTIEIFNFFCEKELDKDILFRGPYCKLYKLNYIKEHNLRFNTKVWIGEDFLFNINYLSYIKTAFITGTYSYNYRETTGSLTHKRASIEDLLIRANAFKESSQRISNALEYPKLYRLITAEMIEGLFRKCYRAHRDKRDRQMAYCFFKQNAEPQMFKYMTFPYSKFGIFTHLPFTISDKVMVAIFKIMNKIKAAPTY